MELASAVTARAPSRAAQYVRMSTEHQQYSAKRTNSTPFRQHAAAHNLANRQPSPISLEKLDIATTRTTWATDQFP